MANSSRVDAPAGPATAISHLDPSPDRSKADFAVFTFQNLSDGLVGEPRVIKLLAAEASSGVSSLSTASRSESELMPDERRSLAAAHAELRAAVKNYEQYLGGELKPGAPIPGR